MIIQTPETVMFWFLAPVAVLAALGMLLAKKAVHSALLLAWVMITLAIFYIAQDALFLGIVGVDSSDSLTETIPHLRAISIVAAVGFGGLIVSLLGRATLGHSALGLTEVNSKGNVQALAALLFSDYVWPFEVVSALLITAALGAMVLAHHQRAVAKPTQRDLSIARFRQGSLAEAAGLPGPGVFARHNAVDVAALLPDGTPAPTSISATLKARGDMKDSAQFQLDHVDGSIVEEK
jgi:NADH-quinone oxidoreductase subunit J